VNKSALLDDLQGCHSGDVDLGPVCCAEADVGVFDLAPVLGCCAEADEGARCSCVSKDLDPEG
jgi:hypothetical protein